MLKRFTVILLTLTVLVSCKSNSIVTKKIEDDSAFLQLQKDAEAGDARKQYELGTIYYSGSGDEIPIDKGAAVDWFQKAATNGLAEAQYTLGFFYDSGEVLPQDKVQAFRFFRSSAQQGVTESQYKLGLAYFTGTGTDKNLEKAFAWLRIANEHGRAESAETMLIIQKSLTPSEMSNALQLYQKFLLIINNRNRILI